MDGPAQTADGRWHLKARVRAVPEDGKANLALENLIADWLSVPRRSVAVISGITSRLKTIEVDGESAELVALIEQAATASN